MLFRSLESARQHQVSSVVARSLKRAHARFGTPLPESVRTALTLANSREPAARFLRGPSLASELRSSLAALDTWAARYQLLREHLVPPRSYMRAKYETWPEWLLPIAYAHRALRGAPRWLKRRVL